MFMSTTWALPRNGVYTCSGIVLSKPKNVDIDAIADEEGSVSC